MTCKQVEGFFLDVPNVLKLDCGDGCKTGKQTKIHSAVHLK